MSEFTVVFANQAFTVTSEIIDDGDTLVAVQVRTIEGRLIAVAEVDEDEDIEDAAREAIEAVPLYWRRDEPEPPRLRIVK